MDIKETLDNILLARQEMLTSICNSTNSMRSFPPEEANWGHVGDQGRINNLVYELYMEMGLHHQDEREKREREENEQKD